MAAQAGMRTINVNGQRLRIAIRAGKGIGTPLLLMNGIGTPLLLMNGIGVKLELLHSFVDALDPAIEITTSASHGIPLVSILIFPALFTAGMSLMDTTDGVLMLGAYGWAFVKPMRKLYYNLNITFISVIVALVVGGLEALSIVATELHLSGPFWDQIGNLDENFGFLGVIIVCLFIGCWVISTIIYKVKRYDTFEVNMAPGQLD